MKRVGEGWQPPNEKNDDLWKIEFESIEGSAVLVIEKTGLEDFDKDAHAVILEDSETGNRQPVSLTFNGAEAENLACDYTQHRPTENEVKDLILELRGDE